MNTKDQMVLQGKKQEIIWKKTKKKQIKTCVYWGAQGKMELTWTNSRTRQRNTSQKSHEIHVWRKVKWGIPRKKKS